MRLAVILPVYNAEKYLVECLDSLLNQTFQDFCILAVNDASTDNSPQILEDYAKKDWRLRVYHFEQNQGDPAATQFAMQLTNYMNVDYVARMDADDICLPERFEKQVAYLDAHPDVGVLGSDMYSFIDGKFEQGYISQVPVADADIKANLSQAAANILNPTSIYRQSHIKPLNLQYNQQPTACDFGLWVDCAIHGIKFANLPDALVYYRLHAGQASNKVALIRASVQVFLERYFSVLFPTLSQEELSGLSAACCNPREINLSLEQAYGVISAYDKIKGDTQSVLGENRQKLFSYLTAVADAVKQAVANIEAC